MNKEFVPYEQALALKELGIDQSCYASYGPVGARAYKELSYGYADYNMGNCIGAPTFSQAINFLYICSNKQIDIELKASDTYEERLRKIDQGCEDLRNLQNSKSN